MLGVKQGAFLVLKLQRTGSSMFAVVLNSHKEVSCKKEFLTPVKKESLLEKNDFLEHFFIKDFKEDSNYDKRIIGGTINPLKYGLQTDDIRDLINKAKANNINFKVILLLRKNLLKQGVSAYVAKESLNYKSNYRRIQDKELVKKRDFDIAKLQEIVGELTKKSKYLQEFAEDITDEYLSISYEDLLENPQWTFTKVFDHIEASKVPDEFDFTGGYQKILSDNLEDIVNNFDELYKYPLLSKYLEK